MIAGEALLFVQKLYNFKRPPQRRKVMLKLLDMEQDECLPDGLPGPLRVADHGTGLECLPGPKHLTHRPMIEPKFPVMW